MAKPRHAGKWVCKKCSKEYSCKQSLHNHKSNCGVKKSNECKICLKVFTRLAYLKKHKCKPKSTLIGVTCDKEFPKKWHLDRHIKSVHSKNENQPRERKSCTNNYLECDEDDLFLPNMVDMDDYDKVKSWFVTPTVDFWISGDTDLEKVSLSLFCSDEMRVLVNEN